jgi:hypothetical protein
MIWICSSHGTLYGHAAHQGQWKKTNKHIAYKKFCQTELNMLNWYELYHWENWNAPATQLAEDRNSSTMQLNRPLFSEFCCTVAVKFLVFLHLGVKWIAYIVEMALEVDEATCFYLCAVNWAGISSMWQKQPRLCPEGWLDMAWEWISHEMKMFSIYVYSSKMYNRIQIHIELVG